MLCSIDVVFCLGDAMLYRTNFPHFLKVSHFSTQNTQDIYRSNRRCCINIYKSLFYSKLVF